jgi:hypothetical protein
MTPGEKLQFSIFFLMLIVWTLLSCLAVARPGSLTWLWRRSSAGTVRLFAAACLVAGLAFWYLVIGELAAGTFKWKGDTKTYGFSDFVR